MNKVIDIDKINATLREKGIYADSVIPSYSKFNDVEVATLCGDWKHEHGYLNYLMDEMGYTLIREEEIYDPMLEGSDCYSSTHIYKKRR